MKRHGVAGRARLRRRTVNDAPAEEAGDVLAHRIGEEDARWSHLRNASVQEERHLVGNLTRLALVVRDEDGGNPKSSLQVADERAHVGTQALVER